MNKAALILAAICLLMLTSTLSAATDEMPLPSGRQSFVYSQTALPLKSPDPAQAKPIGAGSVASGGSILSLQIELSPLAGAADIYVGASASSIDSNSIYLLKQDNTFQPLSAGLVPWKTNTAGPVNEALSGGLQTSWLPSGDYYFYLAVTPSGSLNNYYLWTTSSVLSTTNSHGASRNWGSEVRVSNTGGFSGGSVGRSLAIDSKNRLHAFWNEQGGSSPNIAYDVYYSRSADGGSTWSTPVDIANSPLPAIGPNIAAGPDDTLHLAWNDRRDGGSFRLYYSRSFDGGNNWETPRDLSGTNSLDASTPSVTVDTRNRVHIAWHFGDPGQNDPVSQVYYTRSTDGGAFFDAPRRLNTDTSHHAAWPRFSVDGTNGDLVAVAWRDNRRDPDWDIYIAISTNGGLAFTEMAGQATSNREWDPDIAVDANGILHLSYMTYRADGITIDYRQSGDKGNAWSQEVTLSEAKSRFPFWALDNKHGVLWLFWKDERDADPPPGSAEPRADIACKYSIDRGQTWSPLEFVTDLGDIEPKFPSLTVGPDGRAHAMWSDARYGASLESVFLKSRLSAPSPAAP